MPYLGLPLLIFGLCLTAFLGVAPLAAFGAGAAATPGVKVDRTGAEPNSPRYDRLLKALTDYRDIAERGGWPVLPTGPLLRRGMDHPHIPQLRQRLTATNDLKTGNNADSFFDAALELAVRNFQNRHGIADDGVVGPKTREVLNVPVNRRIDQLRLNLVRRREMQDDLGSRYIFVNMADYVLKVVNDERTVLTMKIVVGTPYRQTPLFSAKMTYIDFNPFWNVPDRIAREEIVPRIRQTPDYLSTQGMRIFEGWQAQAAELAPHQVDWHAAGLKSSPYRLRQDPGPLNPLGQVKFMFPNSFEVYLHDTPAKQLFTSNVRAFSHGCIRVEKPVSLAAHLLPHLSELEVRQVMSEGKRRIFHLANPISVHLTYLTAWVNKDGSVQFRHDIYGRDRLISKAAL